MLYKFYKTPTTNNDWSNIYDVAVCNSNDVEVDTGDDVGEDAWHMIDYIFHRLTVERVSLEDVQWQFAYPGFVAWMKNGVLVVSNKE